ncbi:MAG: hypothetical protein ACRD2C_01615 [Acidimicrobiales bacterium]
MDAFLDAALGFPAVLFTVLLGLVVLYWVTVLVGVVDVDLDGADGVDLEVAADGGAGGDGVGGDGVLHSLGLAGVPLTVSLSVVVLGGWFVALLGTGLANAADVPVVAAILLGLVVLALALAAGVLVASVVTRPLARLFASTEAEGRQAFVGRTCIVRTTTVTDSFGQAEASDGSGATVLLQVRMSPTDQEADLRRGSSALIVDYDPAAEVFVVCPVDDVLGTAEPGP